MAVTRLSVVLRAPAPALGLFTGVSSFPVPDFGDRCVCCGSEDASAMDYDPSPDQRSAGHFEIPVCDACDDHVSAHAHGLGDVLIALAGGIGAVLVLGGLVGTLAYGAEALWAALCGAISMSSGIGAFLLRRAFVRRRGECGHHALEVGVSEGVCVVSTTNAQLVEDLLARNARAKLMDR